MLKSSPTLISRATALAAASKTILPIAMAASASAASLNFDFFGTGLYDDSGWFVSTIAPGDGGGFTQGTGFKLYGTETIDDSIFYRYSSSEERIVPRGDGDGVGLLWGGTIDGTFQAGDILTAPFEFSYDFTHTPGGPSDTYVSNRWQLRIGLLYDYASSSFSWSEGYGSASTVGSAETSGYESAAGSYERSGTLSLSIEDYMISDQAPTHWFVELAVMVSHENDSWNFDGPFNKRNGDTLNVTVPQNSIDLALESVPEPSGWIISALGSLAFFRRRRSNS